MRSRKTRTTLELTCLPCFRPQVPERDLRKVIFLVSFASQIGDHRDASWPVFAVAYRRRSELFVNRISCHLPTVH